MLKIVAVLALLLSLGACSESIKSDSPESGKIKSSAPELQEPVLDAEHQAFVDVVSNEMPELDASALPAVADAICDGLTALTPDEVINTIINQGYSAYNAGYLFGAATGTVCPEYSLN